MTVVPVLLLLLSFCVGDTTHHLEATLTAVEKLVHYYEDHYADMNLDGIYGLRVLEGQVALLLDMYASGQIHNHTPDWLWHRLAKVHELSHNISEKSISALQQSEPEYYKQMQWLVDRPMKFAKDYRKLDPSLRWPSHIKRKGEGMAEEFSDSCMHELMGNAQNNYHKCAVSSECLQQMLQRGHVEYTITHQLLYTILAEQNECVAELEQYLVAKGIGSTVSSFQQDLCTNNFFEVQGLLTDVSNEVVSVYHDLFMEQLFVCPLLGFMEFLHTDWLYQILSWQHPLGCYGKNPRRVENGVRHLLFEREVQGGCLSHKSAVAAGCLSQFLRFLINPGSADYQQYAHIEGRNHLAMVPALMGANNQDGEQETELEKPVLLHDHELQAAHEQVEEEEEEEKEEEKEEDDAPHYYDDDDDMEEERKIEKPVKILHKDPAVAQNPPQQPQQQQQQQQDDDDKEYKEYIDDASDNEVEEQEEEEEKETHNVIKPKFFQDSDAAVGGSKRDNVIKEMNDDGGYNYYEDSKSQPFPPLKHLFLTTTGTSVEEMGGGSGALGTSYVIVVTLMFLVLVFMYRFIRKRRVLIKYRYR